MKKRKFLINVFLIYAIIGTIIWLIVEDCKEKRMEIAEKTKTYTVQNVSIEENINEENINIEKNVIIDNTEEIKQYPKETVIEEFKGYLVSAKLEIPAISLETYILKNHSTQALNISVTKFCGANPNQIGNSCIAGHNFQNKLMFRNLKKLKSGDSLFISDNNVGKIEYKVYDLYRVLPNNVKCLSQDTQGKREVTLITCTNDSKERIIVKAREVE